MIKSGADVDRLGSDKMVAGRVSVGEFSYSRRQGAKLSAERTASEVPAVVMPARR